jgi:dTMP kinase
MLPKHIQGTEINTPYKGLFVTFDGPNGVGKTTLLKKVSEKLTLRGFDVFQTKEPTDTSIGNFIQQSKEEYHGASLACLIAADRYQHIEKEIIPALKTNKIVLSDRYVESSLVLQRIDNVDFNFIWSINKTVVIPNLSVIILASPDTLKQRIKSRETRDFFERDDSIREKELVYYKETIEFLKKKKFNVFSIENELASVEENSNKILTQIVNLL